MSRFFTEKYDNLIPYTPGEQPKDAVFTKLNTNESPFIPSPGVMAAAGRAALNVQLYSDPDCTLLREKMADIYNVSAERIVMVNGSDEVLNFAFMAFADDKKPLVFPDITYGFYPVFAQLNNIPYKEIPLRDDFTIDVSDYMGKNRTVVIPNPNAPTGIPLDLDQIEQIVASDPDSVVIIDEAYVDFGADSAVSLTEKYDNLLVTGTFSKSRSLAGARLGFGIGSPALISDINTIRYSTNPYNVNSITQAAGIAALEEDAYYRNNCVKIMETREWTIRRLEELGFTCLPTVANFIFARSDAVSGDELYFRLREKGVLIRHFTKERIKDYNRITVGTTVQMEKFISCIEEILEEMR